MSNKKTMLSYAMAFALLFTACQKAVIPNETTALRTSDEITVNSVADHVIETGMTLAQINAVIAGASAGETVYVQPGTYTITGKIVMKAGVSLVKQTSTNPIFDASAQANMLIMNYTTEIGSCLFSGLTFWNIRFVIQNSASTSFKYCIFDYLKRTASTNKTNNLKDAYLEFNTTSTTLVSNCVFSHRAADPGRGVWVKNTTGAKILKNSFGNGGSTGYFVCAINDNSLSSSLIDSNTINRNTVLNTVDSLTDHGIYAHSFNGLIITKNNITGWPTNGSGGAIKARNGQNLNISDNILNTSGILLYEYVSGTANPFLKNVVVANNTINVSGPASDIYHGIGYYRDNTTDSEYSIRIENNLLPNGTIQMNGSNVNVTNFNAAGGGVYNNDTATGYLLLKTGIANSGNY